MEHMLIGLGIPVVIIVGLLWFAVKKMKRSPDVRSMVYTQQNSRRKNRVYN
jgi:hypothetical protein